MFHPLTTVVEKHLQITAQHPILERKIGLGQLLPHLPVEQETLLHLSRRNVHQRRRGKETTESHALCRLVVADKACPRKSHHSHLGTVVHLQALTDGARQHHQHVVFHKPVLLKVQPDAHIAAAAEHDQRKRHPERMGGSHEMGQRIGVNATSQVIGQQQFVFKHQRMAGGGKHRQMQFPECGIFGHHHHCICFSFFFHLNDGTNITVWNRNQTKGTFFPSKIHPLGHFIGR